MRARVVFIALLFVVPLAPVQSTPGPGDILDGTNALCSPSARDCVSFRTAALESPSPDHGNAIHGVSSAIAPDGSAMYLARHLTHKTASHDELGRVVALSLEAPDDALWDVVIEDANHVRVRDLAVTPDGATVIAVGRVGLAGGDGFIVALDAATGAQRWRHLEDADPTSPYDEDSLWQVGVSPDGATVYAAGMFQGLDTPEVTNSGVAVFAYDVGTGARQWVHAINGGGSIGELVVAPDGRVYLAGSLVTGAGVLALDSTGSEAWFYHRQYGDFHHVAVSEDGQRIVATGIDYAGGAYPGMAMMWDAAGQVLWRHTETRIGGYTPDLRDVAIGPGYQTFIMGPTPLEDGSQTRGAVRSLDAAGNVLWTNMFPDWGDNRDAWNAAVDYAAGSVYTLTYGHNNHRLHVLSPDGSIQWGADLGRFDIAVERSGGDADQLGLHVTPDGRQVYVAGSDMERPDSADRAPPAVFRYPNHAPVPVIDAPPIFGEGLPVTLDGSASYDADRGDAIVAYEWLRGATSLGTDPALTASTTADTTCYTLRVTDRWGAVGEADVCRGLNHLPVAVLDAVPSIIQDAAGHVFDASASYDIDGDAITEYAWQLDGAPVSGAGDMAVPDLAGLAGEHCISVAVTDSFGLTSEPAQACFEVNRAPILDAVGPAVALVGAEVTFDATGTADADGDAVTVTWHPHWTTVEFPDPLSLSFDMDLLGDQCLDARADDGRGGIASETVCTFVNAPPVAVADDPFATPLNLGQVAHGDASGSFDPNPEHDNLAFQWSLDGVPVSSASTATFGPFDVAGQHCSRVTVWDPVGGLDALDHCGVVSDELVVTIDMRDAFTAFEAVHGTVHVAYQDDSPATQVPVDLAIDHVFAVGAFQPALDATACTTWRGSATTDATGQAAFTMPAALFAQCFGLGGPGVLGLPSAMGPVPVGGYEVRAAAADAFGNSGDDTDGFAVTLV